MNVLIIQKVYGSINFLLENSYYDLVGNKGLLSKKKTNKQENLGITTFRVHKNLSKDVYVKNKDD